MITYCETGKGDFRGGIEKMWKMDFTCQADPSPYSPPPFSQHPGLKGPAQIIGQNPFFFVKKKDFSFGS